MDGAVQFWFSAFREGTLLGDSELEGLLKQVATRPDDRIARAKLAGALFVTRDESPRARAEYLAQALWWIDRHPAEAVTFTLSSRGIRDRSSDPMKLAAAWNDAVRAHAEDVQVLINAAKFFGYSDPVHAREVLFRARAIAPGDSRVPFQLGELETHQSWRGAAARRTERARAALDAFEDALRLWTDDWSRSIPLEKVSRAAFETHDFGRARNCAEALLLYDTGDAVHHGNLVLGRLALVDGNLDLARHHLIEAGHTRGSAPLGSFGPNMQLAKELLERGERDVVLEYFDLCAVFWKRDRGRLAVWEHAVSQGSVPDFGANLVY